MTTLASLLLERVLLLDGGMGTQILARKPSVDDFGGSVLGRKIRFTDLPPDCQLAVRLDCEEESDHESPC